VKPQYEQIGLWTKSWVKFKMKIVADDKIPFLKGVLEPLADIVYVNGKSINREVVKNADAVLVRTRTKCNESLLKNTNVKFVGTATIGFDHIDTKWCESNGIVWANAPGCNSGSVNQYIASTLFNLSEKLGFSLAHRAIGVVGVGNVGRKVVHTAEMLGMAVYLCDPPRVREEGACGYISLNGILRECDIITFHVPLNFHGEDKTFHLINDSFISHVNKSTVIINTSRGEIADSNAIKRAYNRGQLAGFALDVWENEPDVDPELLNLALQGTPHIAGYSADGKATGTAMILRELSRHFDLGFEDWTAADIPVPEYPLIAIDCTGLSNEEVIKRAVMHTYDVRHDDKRLRNDLAGFENQRGDYPVRREFGAYELVLRNAGKDLRRICRKLGFKLAEPIQ
jgi:erythronate-4-phosphate dehydrogenase